jgi:hypothetical protein
MAELRKELLTGEREITHEDKCRVKFCVIFLSDVLVIFVCQLHIQVQKAVFLSGVGGTCVLSASMAF